MTTLSTPDTVKSIRETLALAQSAIHFRAAAGHDSDRATRDAELLGRLIADCDRQRPLGPNGKHGDGERCTRTCGCAHVDEILALGREIIRGFNDATREAREGVPPTSIRWWLDGGPEALLQDAITRADDADLPDAVVHLVRKELLNGLWWLGKVRPMWLDAAWVEQHTPRVTFETGWGELARDVLAFITSRAVTHAHTEDKCGHRLVPLEVEGATTCHDCGDHYAASRWCPQACEVAYVEVITSVTDADRAGDILVHTDETQRPPAETEWVFGFGPKDAESAWRCQRCKTIMLGSHRRCPSCQYTVFDPMHARPVETEADVTPSDRAASTAWRPKDVKVWHGTRVLVYPGPSRDHAGSAGRNHGVGRITWLRRNVDPTKSEYGVRMELPYDGTSTVRHGDFEVLPDQPDLGD